VKQAIDRHGITMAHRADPSFHVKQRISEPTDEPTVKNDTESKMPQSRKRPSSLLPSVRNDVSTRGPRKTGPRKKPIQKLPSKSPGKSAAARNETESEVSPPAEKDWEFAGEDCIAAILDRLLGKLADTDPLQWGRRTYLQLVGMIYMRMESGANKISTAELVSLSRALAENRRVNNQEAETAHEVASSAHDDRRDAELPARLAEVVRRVYGANLQTDVTPREGSGFDSPEAPDAGRANSPAPSASEENRIDSRS
jgi:hypothetical protein